MTGSFCICLGGLYTGQNLASMTSGARNPKQIFLKRMTGKKNTVFARVTAWSAHLFLGSQKRVLILGRHSLNISKGHQNTFNLYL